MVATVVALGTSGAQINQTNTDVVGEETYRTDVTMSNTSSTVKNAVLYPQSGARESRISRCVR